MIRNHILAKNIIQNTNNIDCELIDNSTVINYIEDINVTSQYDDFYSNISTMTNDTVNSQLDDFYSNIAYKQLNSICTSFAQPCLFVNNIRKYPSTLSTENNTNNGKLPVQIIFINKDTITINK